MAELEKYDRPLLKFITCGSVDDGKSTLIGNILYNSKLLYNDQIAALESESATGSCDGQLDYSLLLDGLLAEREQGITIDVAYRYFSTRKRSFIVADTPGHEEYTRNMAVGASFADLAVILADASKGVLPQTRRHARICSLMGIRHFVFAVNKMDLVDFDEIVFHGIEAQIANLARELALGDVAVIPLSAREGDNVIARSGRTPWYAGKALLEQLEETDTAGDLAEEGFYMPIQRVCRPNQFFRGFQGQIESGSVRVGDELSILPSQEKAHVREILSGFEQVQEARAGMPVTISLDREVDVSRGCVFSDGSDGVKATREITATILWTDDNRFSFGRDYLVKIGTCQIFAQVKALRYAIDVNTGEHLPVSELSKNEIAVCRISFIDSVAASRFARHRGLGEFILIDRLTNMTSCCGIVTALADDDGDHQASAEDLRQQLLKQRAAAFGFRESENSARLMEAVELKLLHEGRLVYQLPRKDLTDEACAQTLKNLLNAGVTVLLSGTERPPVNRWFQIESDNSQDAVREILARTSLTDSVQTGGEGI
ncbi:MAG: sulfate adenylyltransferase subunit CysN [Succinivibrionaceae bacterium]|nr:sulfate adenylyltransferase subunit CysN [Succinivibrionaceae bacterium]